MKSPLPSILQHVFSLFGLLTWAAAVEPATTTDSSVLGRIGDTEVKIDDVRASLASLGPKEAAAVARDPALLNQLVRSVLMQKILLREALAKKWEQQPSVVAQLARVREAALTESYLQSVANPPDNYPNDAELQAAYDASKPALLVPRQFRLAQLFIASPKSAEKPMADKAQAKLDAVRKSLKQKDADFSAIARTESEERDSAGRGGEIGWLAETQIQPEIRPQVPGLALNAVSEPIRLDDGWHIIKVLDTREAYTPTLDQIRGQLVQQVRTERTKANSQAYLAKLLQENPLAINELNLSKVLGKAEK